MVLKLSLLRPPSQIESTNSYVTYFLVILPEAHLLRIPSGVRIRRSFWPKEVTIVPSVQLIPRRVSAIISKAIECELNRVFATPA